MTDISVNNQDLSAPVAPSLNIQDIVTLLNIVDVASRRGAFRAEEFTAVGSVYDKVSTFLKSTGAITDPAAERTDTEQPKESEQ